MDNATRRQLLEQAKQVGYTGSILDVFQNPQVLDQFAQEQQVQQQTQVQQPQQQMQVEMPTPPATTPNYKVAQPRQSEAQPLVMSNTEVPIQIRKTGGVLYDKGGPKQREVVYTNPEEFKIANQAYQDSTTTAGTTANLLSEIDKYNRNAVGVPPTGSISKAQYANIFAGVHTGILPVSHSTLFTATPSGSRQPWQVAHYKSPKTKPVLQEAPQRIEPLPMQKLPIAQSQLEPINLNLNIQPQKSRDVYQSDYTMKTGQRLTGRMRFNSESKKWESRPIDQEELDYYNDKNRIDSMKESVETPALKKSPGVMRFDNGGPTPKYANANALYNSSKYNSVSEKTDVGKFNSVKFIPYDEAPLDLSGNDSFEIGDEHLYQGANFTVDDTGNFKLNKPEGKVKAITNKEEYYRMLNPDIKPIGYNVHEYSIGDQTFKNYGLVYDDPNKKVEPVVQPTVIPTPKVREVAINKTDYSNKLGQSANRKYRWDPNLKKYQEVLETGGPTNPPKKQIKRASDEELMFGIRPEVAVQDNTYVTTPRIEEARRDDAKGVTPQQKQKAATAKKKIVAEEKRQQLVNDLSNQGTISPATEGSERLKNQFIYAMDQPLDAMGSLMQRGYVPQGNLNGDYETSSPMSSVIGAFNPVSAVMDVARVGRDLGEKETYTTLSGAGELGLHALGILPSVQLGKQLGKKAIKEAVYWGVEPMGYGVKQKLAYFPANLIKYGYHGLQGNATKVKLKTLESIMENYDKMGEAIVQGKPYKYEAFKDGIKTLYNPKGSYGYEREAQRRLDAWNTTWNKDQLFDTFTKIGENKYVLNAAKYGIYPEQLSSIVSDVEANKLNRLFKKNQISPEEYDASLKALTLKQSWDPQYTNASIESIKSLILKNPENFKDLYHYNPIRKGGATSGYLKNEGYTDVVSASDEFGVRGGFLYHTKPNPDGTIHLRAHDTWDFNPWAKRGQIRNVENQNARKYNDRNVINMLKDIDPIQMLGGKPYDIENNYIFDPVKREIMASYKTGGKKCYTCNKSKLQVLYNKRNYKK